jgi:AcrR family transcriptional regulator
MTVPERAQSSLREQQKSLARRLVVEAASRVILRSGIHQFSMLEVANEAGVSLRTLYRYYPSREELLDGVASEIEQGLEEAGLPAGIEPSTLTEKFGTPEAVAAVVGDAFRMTAQRGVDIGRAWVIINMVTGSRSDSRRGRDRMVRQMVEHFGPHLTEAEKDLAFGVLRYLAGAIAWKVMTDDFGMDTEEVAEAVGWAVRTLLETIEAGGGPTRQP